MKNIYDNKGFFEAYANMPRSRDGLTQAGEWELLKSLFPDVSGKKLLDLGCGYGWHCKYAAQQGAEAVLGIDQSENMIAEAKHRHPDERITYRVCALQDYEYPADDFDVVVSNLVLHYVEDLSSVYKNVHKTLKKDGVFLVNIEHPVFTAGVNQSWIMKDDAPLYWPVDNYYYPGERVTDFLGHAVTKQHHTLTQILNGLIESGFAIEAVHEVEPPIEWRDVMPEEMRRPMMLIVKARKQA
ncbi:MAG: class I SAM-dependent methyltransferase [Oscillospiraceae bacterium]|nr:class I SAM-dependent methyltransferase [Oscillospiraceae bacterium]